MNTEQNSTTEQPTEPISEQQQRAELSTRRMIENFARQNPFERAISHRPGTVFGQE